MCMRSVARSGLLYMQTYMNGRGVTGLLQSVTKKHTDRSTDTDFRFEFFCDECAGAWSSERYPFSLRDSPPASPAEKRAHEIIWNAEHDAAYERANTEALFHFNKCPSCGKRVCDECFCELELGCLKCLSKTKKGER